MLNSSNDLWLMPSIFGNPFTCHYFECPQDIHHNDSCFSDNIQNNRRDTAK